VNDAQVPKDELVAALSRFIGFKRSRSQFFRAEALERFKGNDISRAYRALGAADEIDLMINELDNLRAKIALGEAL
jgi:hypothetical protein